MDEDRSAGGTRHALFKKSSKKLIELHNEDPDKLKLRNKKNELEDAQVLDLEESNYQSVEAPCRFFVPKRHWPTEEYGEPDPTKTDSILLPDYPQDTKIDGFYVSGLRAALEGKPHHYILKDGMGKFIKLKTHLDDGKNILHKNQLEDKKTEYIGLTQQLSKKQKNNTIEVKTQQYSTSKLMELIKQARLSAPAGMSKNKSDGQEDESSDDFEEKDEDENEEDDVDDDEEDSDEGEDTKVSARAALLEKLGLGGAAKAAAPKTQSTTGGAAKTAALKKSEGSAASASTRVPSTKKASAQDAPGASDASRNIVQLDGRGKRLQESVVQELDQLMDNIEGLFGDEDFGKFNKSWIWTWRGSADDDDDDKKEGATASKSKRRRRHRGKESVEKLDGPEEDEDASDADNL